MAFPCQIKQLNGLNPPSPPRTRVPQGANSLPRDFAARRQEGGLECGRANMPRRCARKTRGGRGRVGKARRGTAARCAPDIWTSVHRTARAARREGGKADAPAANGRRATALVRWKSVRGGGEPCVMCFGCSSRALDTRRPAHTRPAVRRPRKGGMQGATADHGRRGHVHRAKPVREARRAGTGEWGQADRCDDWLGLVTGCSGGGGGEMCSGPGCRKVKELMNVDHHVVSCESL